MNSEFYLKKCKSLKSHEVIKILEDFRTLKAIELRPSDQTILISMKVPESLLKAFREKCQHSNMKYQTQIKELMTKWLNTSD